MNKDKFLILYSYFLIHLMYELKTETFSGPLEKLLELIEAQKMDVSEVSMARVTEDFLKYLEYYESFFESVI